MFTDARVACVSDMVWDSVSYRQLAHLMVMVRHAESYFYEQLTSSAFCQNSCTSTS